MYQRYSTADVPRNHEFGFWREVISNAYFHLQLNFRDTNTFCGTLESWDLGLVSLSRLHCNALHYQRLRQHCQVKAPELLVTVPQRSAVEFTQMGRNTQCSPGQFLLEHSDEPYEFSHAEHNDMWVLKLPDAALKARVGNTDRFCAQHFDTTAGMGKLFSDYLQLITKHCDTGQSPEALSLMGMQLVELLGLTLKEAPSVLQSSLSVVRAAHLARIEAYVRRHLADDRLDPESIASENSISLRYLHDLFKDTGQTVAQWVRDLRLQTAYEQLTRACTAQSIAQIAYACGFSDQTQFSHAFKRRYGASPREVLRRSTSGTDQ